MKTYHFLPNKYGRELLLDIGRIEKIPNFNFGAEPHQLSFYDILFIDKGIGYFMLDDNKIALKPGTIIFTSPGHTREWHIKKPIGGYAVFFEKDFLNLFFIDELFLYRFGYFHQYRKPTSLARYTGRIFHVSFYQFTDRSRNKKSAERQRSFTACIVIPIACFAE